MAVLIRDGGRLYLGSACLEASDGTKVAIFTDVNNLYIYKDIDGTPSLLGSGSCSTIHGGGSSFGYVNAAIDSNDLVHIVSASRIETTRDIAYNTCDLTTGLGTWVQAANYTNGAPTNWQCDISIDSNNKPHIIYVDRVTEGGSTKDEVNYIEKTGESWSTPEQVCLRATSTDEYYRPHMSHAPNGDIEAFYYFLTNNDPVHRRRNGTWGSESAYTETECQFHGSPMVAVTSEDVVYRTHPSTSDDVEVNNVDTGYNLPTDGRPAVAVVGNLCFIFFHDSSDNEMHVISTGGSVWRYHAAMETSYLPGDNITPDSCYYHKNYSAEIPYIFMHVDGGSSPFPIYYSSFTLPVETTSQDAFLKGGVEVSDSNSAYLAGTTSISDSSSAYLAGSASTSNSSSAYTHGATNTLDNTLAYLGGSISLAAKVTQYAREVGYYSDWSNNYPYRVRYDDNLYTVASSELSEQSYKTADIGGTAQNIYSITVYIRVKGQAVTDHVYLGVCDNIGSSIDTSYLSITTTEQERSVTFYTWPSKGRSFYLSDIGYTQLYFRPAAGNVGTTSVDQAWMVWNLQGGITKPAFLAGSVNTQDSQGAFAQGSSDTSTSSGAFLAGGIETTSSNKAYLWGDDYEYLIPDGDVSVNSWKNELEGSVLWSSIDEYPFSDSDYAYFDQAEGGEYFEVALSDPAGDLGDGIYTIYWRAGKIQGDDTVVMKVELRQGASTVIATDQQTLTGSYVTYEYQLSQAEIDSITDLDDLRLRFTVVSVT